MYGCVPANLALPTRIHWRQWSLRDSRGNSVGRFLGIKARIKRADVKKTSFKSSVYVATR